MLELSFEYLNKVANQSIFISALLAGFSLTVMTLLLEDQRAERLRRHIFRMAAVATGAFLITIFAMTKMFLMTTEGYPFSVDEDALTTPKILGAITFYLGIAALIAVVSLMGWTKSKSLGWFTTIVGILTFFFVLLMTS
jgi:L-asparagine transporter-like permease